MTKISAFEFFIAWVNTVESRKDYLLSIWSKPKEFTLAIKGGKNSVVSGIGEKLGLKAYEQDYYAIDSIFYSEEDRIPLENQFWFTDIKIAFEHENHFNHNLYQELSHLLITNADLKVLVTYPPNDEPIETLRYLHRIIMNNKHSKRYSELENILLIFGYFTGFQWTGHVFKSDDWKLLKK